jgi:hypothetical protein
MDLDAHTDCKLNFHHHIDFLFPHALTLLGLIQKITFSLPTRDNLLMLYSVLVRSMLEYASDACKFLTTTDSNKLESIQRTFAALCHNSSFFSSYPALL